MSLTANVQEKANMIWNTADILVGNYKPHEYGNVILPMTVLKRFDSVLEPTKEAVLKQNDKLKESPMKDLMLKRAAGVDFYNTSKYTFKSLLADPENIEENFRAYINGFSENVREIISKFKFDGEITMMADKKILYAVIQEYNKPEANLHPDKISNLEMGYIFEEIIRKFSEASNESAGQHYTPREVITLMVNLLTANDPELVSNPDAVRTICDPACGTGGILSEMMERVHELNSSAQVVPFGIEINDQTFAICQSDMLIKGQDISNIHNANTLTTNPFKNNKFDYIGSNVPFGLPYKQYQDAVKAEAALGFEGRFGPGLPPASDSQMLFLEAELSYMKDPAEGGTRMAIIHNGSPLFTGDAGSGPSDIRRYILENDLLEAIVALPNDIFYNTGIATYCWVLSNKKKGTNREGKVQLIDASQMFVKRRKALGDKRNDIPQEAIERIVKIYGDFEENEISKIFNNEDFGYSKITVERPLKDENGNPILKKGKLQPDSSLRDTENVPLTEDIDEYFKREVLPYAPDAWIDEKKTKVGYEIPFTRYFYKYEKPKPSAEIMQEILGLEKELEGSLKEVFS